MTVSSKMIEAVNSGSMVRKMFEEGRELKARYGDNNVFDYSLGNPDLEPPLKFKTVLSNLISSSEKGIHGYMPNSGILEVKEKLAAKLSEMHNVKIESDTLVMTVGAAGAINTVFKTILEIGDEVVALAPFFMEYKFYVGNHGGIVKVAETTADFRPDIEKLSEVITQKTRALIINSPNNPTGVIYTSEELTEIGDILREKSSKFGRPILLIADEPYRKIVFNDLSVPSVFKAYNNSVVVSSFSKDLSLAGERIGYLCPSPSLERLSEFVSAATLANRILGFVNAPALMQRAVAELLDESVDIGIYQERVKVLSTALRSMGYKLVEPQGTFYLFPKSPLENDLEFVEILKKQLILAVPGTGFYKKGYFRLSLCLDLEKIKRSIDGFGLAYKESLAKL